MAVLYPGSAYISGRTLLDHPHTASGRTNTFFFDATVAVAQPITRTRLMGTLSYEIHEEDEQVPPGIYHIHAKCHSTPAFTWKALFFTIPTSSSWETLWTYVFQQSALMEVISNTDSFAQCPPSDTPPHYFVRHPEYLDQEEAQATTVQSIRAVLGIRRMWPPREGQLPCPNSIISWSGELLDIEDDVAVVAINDIVYLPRPSPVFPSTGTVALPELEEADEQFDNDN
ncbi:hypothetical protein EDB85DRAFT_2160920 [Lactarius pseudohatsudake]|nr:hypothetical protein EDB85DRAFT_2160920 [Lactarius pseudohatsudake]